MALRRASGEGAGLALGRAGRIGGTPPGPGLASGLASGLARGGGPGDGPGLGGLRAVLFDKDGTLFDFQATWGAWSRGMIEAESEGDPWVARRLADALGYDLATSRFRPDSVAIASTTATVAEILRPLLPRPVAHDDLVARMNARAEDAPQVEAAPLREVLGRLKGMGLRLGVATNDGEAPARAHLRGVLDLLDFVAGYDSGWGGKPAPGQLLAFAEAVGVEPGACAMVGDSLHDLAAARAAGMVGVGVLTGPALREALAPAAEAVLGSVAELPGWVERRNGGRLDRGGRDDGGGRGGWDKRGGPGGPGG